MKLFQVKGLDKPASRIALGFWRAGDCTPDVLERLVKTALDAGVNFFDHADIYGGGASESLFGELLRAEPGLRGRMLVQSKCGIVPGPEHAWFDFSERHILEAVEGSLQRLHTDYLDSLLLHRPDALVEPAEVAAAFRKLHDAGKVRVFGVSNMNAAQISFLQKALPFPLVFDQMQMSIVHCPMIDQGFEVNMTTEGAVNRDGSTLDYLREHDIILQPWSVMQGLRREGTFLGNPKYEFLNRRLGRYAAQYGIPENALAVAWLLRHPAGFQPIVGTTSPEHLKELARAADVELSREDWYDLYWAAGKIIP